MSNHRNMYRIGVRTETQWHRRAVLASRPDMIGNPARENNMHQGGSRFGRWIIGVMLAASAWALHAAEVGVTEDRILLGQSAAFTGPAAQLGIQMNIGARVFFDQLNRNGGVSGRKIELAIADDQYEAEKAAANTKKFIEQDRVFALFGYVGTPTSNAAMPIFTAAKVPFFAPYTGAMSLREPFNRYVFNIRASYVDETAKIVEYLTTVGIKKIAVFYQNDAYGKAGLDGTTRALDARKLKVAATATVERNSTDVAKAVDTMVQAQPDAIVLISAYSSCAAFIKAMKAKGYAGQFHNVSFVGSKALADALGTDGPGVAISQVMPFPFSGSIAIAREYQKAMADAGQKELNWSSFEGYIAAKVFAEGLRRAGRDLTRERLIYALEGMARYDVGGFDVSFGPGNHNGSKFVELTIIGGGGKFLR